jgi:acyl carrier protein
MRELLKTIIIDHVPTITPDDITDSANFADLGVDSLALIEIFLHIGQEMKLEIPPPDDAFWKEHTVQNISDLINIIERLKKMHQMSDSDKT